MATPRRSSAHWQSGREFRRGNSRAVMSIPQASVSKPAARQVIQKRELTCCHVNPPGERQQAGSAAGDSAGELTGCHANPPGGRQQSSSAAGDSERAHMLSCQSPRRASATQQRSRRFRKGSHAVLSIPQATVSSPTGGKGFRRGNSLAVIPIPQASVSKPAARHGIQKGELTRCHVNPPGERQLAGSAAGDSERGTHSLSCQPPRRASARRQRGR